MKCSDLMKCSSTIQLIRWYDSRIIQALVEASESANLNHLYTHVMVVRDSHGLTLPWMRCREETLHVISHIPDVTNEASRASLEEDMPPHKVFSKPQPTVLFRCVTFHPTLAPLVSAFCRHQNQQFFLHNKGVRQSMENLRKGQRQTSEWTALATRDTSQSAQSSQKSNLTGQ